MGAASLAVDAVNRRSSLLNGTRLECTFYEFECGVNSAIPLLAGVLDRTPFGAVIGPGCMEECESSAILSGSLNIPLISYGCVASETLKNAQRYPTVPSELSCSLRIAGGACPGSRRRSHGRYVLVRSFSVCRPGMRVGMPSSPSLHTTDGATWCFYRRIPGCIAAQRNGY